ncbi:hypothetical protein F4805DRAFT_475099 [Annulohypoxylon moriforme]|nr:hypothetical protein F4805DRAFT_475099 [Annulohypoxylon moriforme]
MAPQAFTTTTLTLLTLLAGSSFSSCQEHASPPDATSSGVIPTPTPVPDNSTRGGSEGPNGLRIIDEDESYRYAGCWSETTEAPPHDRALDGIYLTLVGQMQVKSCVEYCARSYNRFHPEKKGWRYAGLEYARECWCGENLSLRSVHLPESACDAPCDGASSVVCGGHLAITLYNATNPGGKPGDSDTVEPPKENGASGSKTSGAPVSGGSKTSGGAPVSGGSKTSDASKPEPVGEAVAQAVGIGLVVVAVTFVLGMGCL